MRLTAIMVATWILSCGWALRADAQTSRVTTEYLMTYQAPLDRHRIDGSTVVVTCPLEAGSRDPAFPVRSSLQPATGSGSCLPASPAWTCGS
jgi:hypothetical protein